MKTMLFAFVVLCCGGCSSFGGTFKALPDGTIECSIDLRYNLVSSDAEFSVRPVLETITTPHLDTAGKPILDPAGKPMEKIIGYKPLAWIVMYHRRTDVSSQLGDIAGKALEGAVRGGGKVFVPY